MEQIPLVMEHATEILLGLALITPLVTSAAAFASVKASLNGTKQRVEAIEATVLRVEAKIDGHERRLTQIEERCRIRGQMYPTTTHM